MVPKRLQKTQRPHRHLSDTFAGDAIPVESEKLEQLLALIARGLVWHRWKLYIHDTHSVRSFTINPAGVQLLDAMIFKRNARNRVNENGLSLRRN